MKEKYFDDLVQKKALARKVLSILKEKGVNDRRIRELDDVIFRTGWLSLVLLEEKEREMVVSSLVTGQLTAEEKEFLLLEKHIEDRIKDKLGFCVIKAHKSTEDLNTAQAREYVSLPENNYLLL